MCVYSATLSTLGPWLRTLHGRLLTLHPNPRIRKDFNTCADEGNQTLMLRTKPQLISAEAAARIMSLK